MKINPQYSTKVMNSLLGLYASDDKRSFYYVSTNLCIIFLFHTQQMISSKWKTIFMNQNKDSLVENIEPKFFKLQTKYVNPSIQVVYSIGFNETVLVKYCQFSKTHGAIFCVTLTK